MNAKKCDRCGLYYVNNILKPSYSIDLTLWSRTVGISLNKVIEKISDGDKCSESRAKNYDLCDQCIESFREWLGIEAENETD